jgi:ubiquinone/menaquinone biosynthesis C-methylase UbiE
MRARDRVRHGPDSELIARSGAHLTSLDLSPVSVQMTQRRFELKGLTAKVQQGDAESLPFADQSFDFIWSWGVIHHSSRTGRIVREIARVCSPAGRVCVMVYNRQALSVGLGVLRDQLLRGGLGRRSIEESLYANTDGYTARHYVKDQFEDLFRTFFREVSSEICGQESDVLPLPRRLRDAVMRYLPESYAKQAQARRGAFIVLRARSPE